MAMTKSRPLEDNKEIGYYEEFEDENFVDIHFMSKDRQYVREVDEAFSALADRINEGGDEELKRLLRVIDAYLDGGDDNVYP